MKTENNNYRLLIKNNLTFLEQYKITFTKISKSLNFVHNNEVIIGNTINLKININSE